MAAKRSLPNLPFRNFFTYRQTTDFIEKLVVARPDLCRLESLGLSREGRQLHLLTLTNFASGRPQDRPGYLIHANIHAGEMSGTHVALFTARQLLVERNRSDLLDHIVFYIVPRLNPDGAEEVATTAAMMTEIC